MSSNHSGQGARTSVRNKSAAAVQITAEQLLRRANEYKGEVFKPTEQKIVDEEELIEFRAKKREDLENQLRMNRHNASIWIRYGEWEASQQQFKEARSVFERALDIHYRNEKLWYRYIDMEMKNKFVNHARTLYDRVVTYLPRVDQFWLRYAHMEEMLENLTGCRVVFQRWMKFKPSEQAWNTYINFEVRHQNMAQARAVYEQYLVCHNTVNTYLKYAKFEQRRNCIPEARVILERAMEELQEDANDKRLFLGFAKFEEECKEFARARVIFKYGLEHVPAQAAEEIYAAYTRFEKQHGTRSDVERVVLAKQRFAYEDQVTANGHNYDAWFDYLLMEEGKEELNITAVRELYQRAVANVPPVKEKALWRRYIYLWINFAVFEELRVQEYGKTEAVYEQCLELIPHNTFTFAKIWILYARFLLRRRRLDDMRKLLGRALGTAPKNKLFKTYIDLERQLGEMGRCRLLYQKYLQFAPYNSQVWIKYASLEVELKEYSRARALFDLALKQERLDAPETIWKACIDFEIACGTPTRVRELFNLLLSKTQHVKVWLSLTQFEATLREFEAARAVFKRAMAHFKEVKANEDRALIVESWRQFEAVHGTEQSRAEVKQLQPVEVKKRRRLVAQDGSDAGWEEYIDYQFPDDKQASSGLKILEMAMKWKKQEAMDTSE